MYEFLYNKKEEGTSNFILTIALVCFVVFLGAAILLFKPALSTGKSLLENMPKKAELIVILPENCDNCFDIYQVSDFIESVIGIKYNKTKEYRANEKNADLLMKAYDIRILPTFIIKGDLKNLKLDELFSEDNIGQYDDDVFVYKNYFPPYYSLDEDNVRGEFDVTYLYDPKCSDCYDVYLHDVALMNLLMAPHATSTYDVASKGGVDLLNKYQIKHAPTILLRGDLNAYQNFNELWKTVGTVESDGTYVFREDGLKSMGAYENVWTKVLYNKE
ncbi:MAG: hypothetical protein COU51_04270 [Parcubacteria group bacterium CG10_big_fil_rev_8_21_14_0_10_36_14]|nr:MAG: hypothetical protein COU51_04270 [Parcubacteria group bacterium CG10_big_fil_rev_8_21_14_0_10_36_14]